MFNTDDGLGYLADRTAGAAVGADRRWSTSGSRSICNVLAAIKTAKLLDLGPDDAIDHRRHRRCRAVPQRAGQDHRRATSAAGSPTSMLRRCWASTWPTSRPTHAIELHRARPHRGSSTSATTRGSSSRARRSSCSRRGGRRTSGADCGGSCRVWDEMITEFNARVARPTDATVRSRAGWSCAVCGAHVDIAEPLVWRCPNATDADPHHALQLVQGTDAIATNWRSNPFVAFRPYLAWDSFAAANGMTERGARRAGRADGRRRSLRWPARVFTPRRSGEPTRSATRSASPPMAACG